MGFNSGFKGLIDYLFVISDFRREVAENCALMGYYYAASCGNFFQKFRHNLLVSSSGFKNPKESL